MSRFVVVTKWSYPFGGGEAYCHELLEWCAGQFDECIWISFTTPDNRPHAVAAVESRGAYMHLALPGGFSEEVLYHWVKLLRPRLVYTQGMLRYEIVRALHPLRIPVCTGLHFWNDVLRLAQPTYNMDILEHEHAQDPKFLFIQKHAHPLSVSEFVNDVVERYYGIRYPVVYPVSAELAAPSARAEEFAGGARPFVTMVNIHRNKGGEFFLYLLRHTDLPLLGVQTEYLSEDLDAQISAALRPNCRLLGRQQDLRAVFAETRVVLCLSQVDETFGRVAAEAMYLGLPVLSSQKGNLKYLFPDAEPVETPEQCAEVLGNIYGDAERLAAMGAANRERYLHAYSAAAARAATLEHFQRFIRESKRMNVAIFAPFCDQGLGIQARHYARSIREACPEFRVYVFSYRPYHVAAGSTARNLQSDPAEWEGFPVYYSTNDREHVLDEEVRQFVQQYNIGVWLHPETCWFRVFELADLLRRLDVRSVAIPNIEIVRRDELHKHRAFDHIWCNNALCQDTFEAAGFQNCSFLGYGLPSSTAPSTAPCTAPSTAPSTAEACVGEWIENGDGCRGCVGVVRGDAGVPADAVRMLLVGGLNAVSRKGAVQAARALAMCDRKDLRLTITVQKYGNEKLRGLCAADPRIELIDEHLDYERVLQLYCEHDIVLHISRSEGLGLGFYEALAAGRPVLTLDKPPHCEIVQNGVNGVHVRAEGRPMPDNDAALIQAWYIDERDLAEAFGALTKAGCTALRPTQDLYGPFCARLAALLRGL